MATLRSSDCTFSEDVSFCAVHPSSAFQMAMRDDLRVLCRAREFDKADYN
jgi:hypothetical protein